MYYMNTSVKLIFDVDRNKLGLSCAKLSCQLGFCGTVSNICCLILIDMK